MIISMKNISELTHEDLKDIKLIVLDVDGVVVPRGSMIEQDGNRTTFETKKVRSSEIDYIKDLYDTGFKINISSGRSLFMLHTMFRSILPYVSITYENGSATWLNGKITQHINTFNELVDVRDELSKVTDKRIKGWEPKEFIITIHCTSEVPEIEKIVSKYKDINILWNGEAYDIMHKSQSKANGITYLLKMANLKRENVIAIGDNYNDKEMLEAVGLAISADCDRVGGDYYVPMPAGVMMWKILQEK
jgi:HAD superfamily hydrolase (TIGR01484 family)